MLHPRKDYAQIQDPANLIPKDEPVFLMRAQDQVAAGVVRQWAQANTNAGGDLRLSRLAMEHATKMEAWPVHKLADLPDVENIDHPEDEPAADRPKPEPYRSPGQIEPGRPLGGIKPFSKPGAGVVSGLEKSESKPGAGVVSKPEKSQNTDGSGVS